MPNPFCHVELNTTDVKKAKEFYGKLFNWKLEDMPGGNYTMIGVGEGTGGGMMKNPIPGAPSFWLSYILVDDIQAATKKAKSLGGTVMKDVTPVPNYRRVQRHRRPHRRAFRTVETKIIGRILSQGRASAPRPWLLGWKLR